MKIKIEVETLGTFFKNVNLLKQLELGIIISSSCNTFKDGDVFLGLSHNRFVILNTGLIYSCKDYNFMIRLLSSDEKVILRNVND